MNENIRDFENSNLKTTQIACIDRRWGFNTKSFPRVDVCLRRPIQPRRNKKGEFPGPYRDAVGGLLQVANAARLDISNAVREVATQAQTTQARVGDSPS